MNYYQAAAGGGEEDLCQDRPHEISIGCYTLLHYSPPYQISDSTLQCVTLVLQFFTFAQDTELLHAQLA